ncbi:hypothetical protein ACFVW8_03190 [Streptomyces sp. NPDC058221]|uniref:hypothetical protein n=1 Tax=Streptomyces sp. NPDC058221 TaxID=3346388 RepID=UPI0036EC1CD2
MNATADAAPNQSALRPELPLLYIRSRGLPRTVAALACVVLLAAWAADWLEDQPGFDHTARVPVLVLAPLLVSAAVGTSLYAAADELDRTAVRRWWPRRLTHLLALTLPAAAALALAVPGHPEAFGAPGMVRNVLGASGVAAASAALVGARLSWLPMTVYCGAVYLAAPRTPGGAAALWAWPMQPGPQAGAWFVALPVYAVGAALFAVRGARTERG